MRRTAFQALATLKEEDSEEDETDDRPRDGQQQEQNGGFGAETSVPMWKHSLLYPSSEPTSRSPGLLQQQQQQAAADGSLAEPYNFELPQDIEHWFHYHMVRCSLLPSHDFGRVLTSAPTLVSSSPSTTCPPTQSTPRLSTRPSPSLDARPSLRNPQPLWRRTSYPHPHDPDPRPVVLRPRASCALGLHACHLSPGCRPAAGRRDAPRERAARRPAPSDSTSAHGAVAVLGSLGHPRPLRCVPVPGRWQQRACCTRWTRTCSNPGRRCSGVRTSASICGANKGTGVSEGTSGSSTSSALRSGLLLQPSPCRHPPRPPALDPPLPYPSRPSLVSPCRPDSLTVRARPRLGGDRELA